jgi:ABC-2 type transport system ATP-binding protein
MPLLEAVQLSHSYGSFQALAPLDLSIGEGEIVILEGPNGSGKTTLMLCLSGLMHPTTGVVKVDGHDLFRDEVEAMRCLAFATDVPRFYNELTAWEHLQFLALAHTAGEGFESRAEIFMKEFGLWEARDLLPSHYSRGMSLKLGLVFALIRPYKILLLDEPTSALDTKSRTQLLYLLKEVRDQGSSVLLSTHDPSLKHGLADHAFLMEAGHLLAN